MLWETQNEHFYSGSLFFIPVNYSIFTIFNLLSFYLLYFHFVHNFQSLKLNPNMLNIFNPRLLHLKKLNFLFNKAWMTLKLKVLFDFENFLNY